jgi:NADPH-dependent curcumin reductase CurA
MEALQSHRYLLASRPVGEYRPSDLRLETVPVDPPGSGQVIVAVDALSIDAFIRTTFDEGSYHQSASVGGMVMALGVGRVTHSADASLQVGDVVFGPLGAQTVACLPAGFLRKLDVTEVPATAYLGALGLTTGVTAYFGVIAVGAVGEGDVVVVSGAAGAVGSIAGQIARIAGAETVIGVAGGPEKCAFLVDELGFDAAIDYRNDDIGARLTQFAPRGIDVFFDNVGGRVLDTALLHISEGARVVICGAISQYEHMDAVQGPTNYLKLAERHARMEGFAVTHFGDRFPEAEAALRGWLLDGRLVVREHVEQGIERFPEALAMLFSGGHTGKLLVRV